MTTEPSTSTHNAPIGVFDSGIGGLSVLRALRAELPHERFVYFADSGHAPYGERGDAFVIERSRAITAYLRANHGIKALVVACNTATAAAIHLLRAANPGLPIIGVEPALKPAVAASRTGHIGVIGTRGTLSSAKFQALLAAQATHARFTVQPCDGLANAIERSTRAGTENAMEISALCARYISAMGHFGPELQAIDTLVLGCTHYIFAADLLQALAGPGIHLIDTGTPVARRTRSLLEAARALSGQSAPDMPGLLLSTTGEPEELRQAACRWLGDRAWQLPRLEIRRMQN
ncbi:MAG TPA: glutamate racemase [Burkholderiaceae bacterium]